MLNKRKGERKRVKKKTNTHIYSKHKRHKSFWQNFSSIHNYNKSLSQFERTAGVSYTLRSLSLCSFSLSLSVKKCAYRSVCMRHSLPCLIHDTSLVLRVLIFIFYILRAFACFSSPLTIQFCFVTSVFCAPME